MLFRSFKIMFLCKIRRYEGVNGTRIKQCMSISCGNRDNICYHSIRSISILLSECINPSLDLRLLACSLILSYCWSWDGLNLLPLGTLSNPVTPLSTRETCSSIPMAILIYTRPITSRALWQCLGINTLCSLFLGLKARALLSLPRPLLLVIISICLSLIKPHLH